MRLEATARSYQGRVADVVDPQRVRVHYLCARCLGPCSHCGKAY